MNSVAGSTCELQYGTLSFMINYDLNEQDELFAGRLIKEPGRIEQLIEFLRSRSVRKIMIVHGRNSYGSSGAAQIFGS